MFSIERDGKAWRVSSDPIAGSVDGGGEIFMRRARNSGGAEAMWLVARLNGTSCYFKIDDGRVHFHMTAADLYPQFEDKA